MQNENLANWIYGKHIGDTTEVYERFLAHARRDTTLRLNMIGLFCKHQLEAYNTALEAQKSYSPMLTDEVSEIIGNDVVIDAITDIDGNNAKELASEVSNNRFFLVRLCEIYAIVKELGTIDLQRLKREYENRYF
jgi:hypothetical protein